MGHRFFVCPAKLANPVGACHRPRPVSGEENPTRKGVSGQRWGLKEAIGSQRERSVSELDSADCRSERAKRREARYRNNCNK